MRDRARGLKSAATRRLRAFGFRAREKAFAAGARLRGATTVRLLLISDGENYTSEEQFAPFKRFARPLYRQLGLITRFMSVEEAKRCSAARLRRHDIIGLKMTYRSAEGAAVTVTRHLRSAIDGSPTRLFYFDGDDDLDILWPELVSICDRYVKKHVYRNRADYAVCRIGKSNLTDYVASTSGWSFADDPIPRNRPLDLTLSDRITVGWNIALDDKIAALARSMPPPSADERPTDVCSRAVVSPQSWIFPLRDPVARRLEELAGTMSVHVPRNRVGQDEYYREMLSSKICVSPFGYGELCWRDFEAIICGCLLVKPAMDHAETLPDIFQPGITYVPVKWDYSDLGEVCAHYLAHPEERRRIVAEAYRTVMESQTADWFIDRVATTLELRRA